MPAGSSAHDRFFYRPAGLADATLLQRLGVETFLQTFGHLYTQEDLDLYLPRAYDEAEIARELAGDRTRYFLAEDGGKAAGYVKIGPCKLPVGEQKRNTLELHRLYVLPSHQGTGIAHRLMQLALEEASRNGAEQIFLGVWSENTRAQRFYASYGFEKSGTYDFMVGRKADLEFILFRRMAQAPSLTGDATQGAQRTT